MMGFGFGLAQWTFSTRKEGLYKYAKSKQVSIDDEDTQIEYLIGELTPGGGANGYATYCLTLSESYSVDDWINASTVAEATTVFCYKFEAPGDPQIDKRINYAIDFYNEFNGRTKPANVDINVELTGENKTKMEQLLTEAQRIANDDRYTYSQDNRYSEFQYDCSSFVYRLYKQFFNLDVPQTTAAYGEQYRVGPASSTELQPGDVLWRHSNGKGHVTLYIGKGVYVAAKSSQVAVADQISIYNDNPSNYTFVYRFITE